MFCTPLIFFYANRFFGIISTETLKYEITGAILSGYGLSYGLWYLYQKTNKNSKQK